MCINNIHRYFVGMYHYNTSIECERGRYALMISLDRVPLSARELLFTGAIITASCVHARTVYLLYVCAVGIIIITHEQSSVPRNAYPKDAEARYYRI